MTLYIHFLNLKRSLGWCGGTGILIILVALFVYGLAIYPTQAHIASHTMHLKQRQINQHSLGTNTQDLSEVSSASPVIAMPSVRGLPEELSALLDLVEQQNLTLITGEYKLSQTQNEDDMEYEMNLPLKGRYQDIRYFIDSLSSKLPYVGIKSLDLKRELVSDAEIEAKLNLVFYLQHQKGDL